MIELGAPRPARPDHTHQRFAVDGEIFDVYGIYVQQHRTDADIALANLRETMSRRIDGAFACHARHHMHDIARRFEYLERPDLRIYEEEMRRITNSISLAYMRGEIPTRGEQ